MLNLKLKMAAAATSTFMALWLKLLVTIVILAELPYCWSGSMHPVRANPVAMKTRYHITSQSQFRSAGSAEHIIMDDSLDPESHASKKLGAAADVDRFRNKLLFARAAGAKSDIVGSRRLLAAAVDGDNITSNEEVGVLTAFKAAVTSDPLGALGSWHANDSDACGWEGITCTPTSKHVVALNLSGLQLAGTLSNLVLGKLPFLQQVDVSNNYLDGSLPPSLTNCSNLLYLNASYNQLSGEIVHTVGELLNLQILDLSHNNLTGIIPGTLGNCSSLRQLNLEWNFIHGEIPPPLGRLANLQFLSLANNSLSGPIPPALGNLSSLIQLQLGYNIQLGGEIPIELNRLKSIQVFRLPSCSFAGAFPEWFVNCTSLKSLSVFDNQFSGDISGAIMHLPPGLSVLDLQGNYFDGQIPGDIGQLQPGITKLGLSENNLTGVIPTSILKMTNLTYLGLQENQLTGPIPPEIGLLTSLEQLRLFQNKLTGIIPPSLSNCSHITHFLLGFNQFDSQVLPSWTASMVNISTLFVPAMNLQGEIPVELGQLPKVIEILVYANNLTGGIPASLGNCTTLDVLNVRSNLLTGEVPLEIGLLSQLSEFQISFNSFTGRFPAQSFNMTQLVYFHIEGNNFTGNIDGDFGRLGKLEDFQAFDNKFYGPFPEGLANCSTLRFIRLGGNSLTGPIPTSLANLTKLESLWLGSNQFRGELPLNFMNFPIFELHLEDNELEGAIPAEIGQFSSLSHLFLSKNNFSGILPNSLGNCTELIDLDLSNNRFSGDVPGNAISKMSASLTYLDLSYNFFSGAWPSQFIQLTNIQVINVSANNMSGSISSGLEGCKALSFLDLSLNNFSGAIPRDLGFIQSLQFFNASYNKFEGQIPDSGVFENNLTAASFLGNLGLCGSILGPRQQCPVLEASAPGSAKSCEGFKCKKFWIPVISVSIVGIVLIFGAALYWIFYGGERNNSHHNVFLNFDSHMKFNESDILATIDVGEENVIGIGAKSIVYKGLSRDGQTFAIKKLRNLPKGRDDDDHGKQWEMELLREVDTLAQLRHRNIIKVLCFYSSVDVKAIVLEYMPQGSLHEHLHENGPCELTWEVKFRILIGVAHALVYLHHEFPDPIIHRDLKPSNILLDADMEPKVCDFGISKVVNPDPERGGEATASTFCGTIGYIPPEYGTGTRVTTKGDVYSYGVVLLELLTGRPGAIGSGDGVTKVSENEDFVSGVRKLFQESPFQLSLDSNLISEGIAKSMSKKQILFLVRVGLLCTRAAPQNRPSMRDVLGMLLQIKDVGKEPITPMTLEDLAQRHTPMTLEDLAQPHDNFDIGRPE